MKNIWRIVLFFILIGFLVLVRFFEVEFFYDPFMHFFQPHPAYVDATISDIQLFLNVILRYWINSCISLCLLYVVFSSKGILKFAVIFYLLCFIVLFPLFIILMQQVEMHNYLAVFYVRRFLVHPIFILILLPAFYYHRIKTRKKGNY